MEVLVNAVKRHGKIAALLGLLSVSFTFILFYVTYSVFFCASVGSVMLLLVWSSNVLISNAFDNLVLFELPELTDIFDKYCFIAAFVHHLMCKLIRGKST